MLPTPFIAATSCSQQRGRSGQHTICSFSDSLFTHTEILLLPANRLPAGRWKGTSAAHHTTAFSSNCSTLLEKLVNEIPSTILMHSFSLNLQEAFPSRSPTFHKQIDTPKYIKLQQYKLRSWCSCLKDFRNDSGGLEAQQLSRDKKQGF